MIKTIKAIFDLEWIPAFGKWILKLASYSIELPMVISAIYIMLVSGIPTWKQQLWYDRSIGLLLASPEILLPGAILRATSMLQRGEVKKAKVTIWVISGMAGLTALTLACIMIFHLDETSPFMACVLFLRILASLAYSIITRIDMDHQGTVSDTPAVPVVYGPEVPVEVLIQQALTQHTQDYKQMIADLSQRLETANNLARIEQQRLQTVVREVQDALQIATPSLSEEQVVNSVIDRLQTVFVEQQAASKNSGGQKREQSTNTFPEARKRSTNTGEMEAIKRPKKIDPDEVDALVHPLLDKDSTLTHRKIAALPHIPYTETVVYASVKRWREQHPIESDVANTDDASEVS